MFRSIAARTALASLLACVSLHAAADEPGFSGELRAVIEPRSANERSSLVRAATIAPGLVAPQRSGATFAAELRARGHGLTANALLQQEQLDGGAGNSRPRINELYASRALPFGNGWQWSAGKKIVGWDVGYGWRPNDVVEQEERRLLVAQTPEGRPLLQIEHFDADTAWSLVWVNPMRSSSAPDHQRGARESALAARFYRRDGAVDRHAFARVGEHTGASIGAALAWVATDSLELHASARLAQRHDGWAFDDKASGSPVISNPWSATTQGAASQWLVGLSWTGTQQFGVLAEAWHDGAALSDDAWKRWSDRNTELRATRSAPPAAIGANLAWQATSWTATNLRRDNLFVRLSWQHEGWQPAFDMLYTPVDRGRTVTASWPGKATAGESKAACASTAVPAMRCSRSCHCAAAAIWWRAEGSDRRSRLRHRHLSRPPAAFRRTTVARPPASIEHPSPRPVRTLKESIMPTHLPLSALIEPLIVPRSASRER